MSKDDERLLRPLGGAHGHGPMMPYEEALRRAMERRKVAAERDKARGEEYVWVGKGRGSRGR